MFALSLPTTHLMLQQQINTWSPPDFCLHNNNPFYILCHSPPYLPLTIFFSLYPTLTFKINVRHPYYRNHLHLVLDWIRCLLFLPVVPPCLLPALLNDHLLIDCISRPWMFSREGSGLPQLDGPCGNLQVQYIGGFSLAFFFKYRNNCFQYILEGCIPAFSRCHSRYMARARVGEDAWLRKPSRLRYKDSSWGDILSAFCLGQPQDKAETLYKVPRTGGPIVVVYSQMGTRILWSNLHSNCIPSMELQNLPIASSPVFQIQYFEREDRVLTRQSFCEVKLNDVSKQCNRYLKLIVLSHG